VLYIQKNININELVSLSALLQFYVRYMPFTAEVLCSTSLPLIRLHTFGFYIKFQGDTLCNFSDEVWAKDDMQLPRGLSEALWRGPDNPKKYMPVVRPVRLSSFFRKISEISIRTCYAAHHCVNKIKLNIVYILKSIVMRMLNFKIFQLN